jgi:RHS repeat-associated protein
VNFTTATYASLEITAPVAAFGQGDAVPFNANARFTDGSGTDVSAQVSWSTSDANVARVTGGLVTGHGVGGATITATFNGLTATKAVTIQSVTVPVVTPTAVNRTIVQPLAETVRFLYSGPDAVQTGVAPNAINDDRVATVRGSVHTRGGAPIAGVEITLAGHPELGHTFTRADGRFDLAFNGGGTATLIYRKAAWLEARRLVTSLWNEQKVVDDVVLVPFDTKASLVTMSNAAPQIARASQVSDSDGARTTALILPAGESATVTTPDGTVTTPSSLHLRTTEYTVGDSGPKAMPAPLPPFSGYTYCVELSADEANGGSVQFSKPVSVYLENFLAFPVGTQIPLAYYDHNRSSWIAARNGRVIRIVVITAGVAMIDTNGDSAADDDATLAALGFDDGERRTLAANYNAGQSLWRMRTNHFSTWDGNLSVAPPVDAVGPKRPKPQTLKGKTQAKCQLSGWSIVDCANQTLGESIAIQGTPYALEYDSSRAGQSAYSTEVELSGPSVPASMIRIELHVTIAGQDHLFTFPPQPNLKYTFTWDGRDGFGRPIQGACSADITITYIYPMRYTPTSSDPGWNVPADAIIAAERRAGNFRMSEGAQLFLGHFGAGDAGFGGWTFSGLRQYDGIGRVIYDGGGTERAADPQQTHETALATLTLGPPEDLDLFTMTPAPDGTLYFSDGYKIRKTSPDGTTTDVAGTAHSGFTPDGFNALGNPTNLWQITTGPDGTLYVIDGTRVRAIVNGRWITIAGNDTYEQGEQPEGVPATSRSITAWALAVGPDGAVYIGSLGHIYKIDPDGTIRTIAGIRNTSAPQGDFVDGASAFSVPLGIARTLAVGPDGSVYFANTKIVGRVTPDGHLFHVMTNTPSNDFYPNGVSVAEDGTVLVADIGDRRVWMIGADGVPVSFAGTGEFQSDAVLPAIGMSRSFMLGSPLEAKIAADGSVVILDWWFEAIRHVGASFPPARVGTSVIPSPDASLAYLFESGRHERTVDALTNVTLETFQYDAAGNLTGITDLDGLVTQIERNGAGDPTAIVAPNGQRTTLAMSGGVLQSITEPGGAAYGFGYGSNSLLTSLTDRRGGLHKFTYDDDGLLSRDEDPAGGFISLTRTGIGNTFNVLRASAEGRTNSYATAVDASGSEMHTHVGPDGLPTTSSFYAGNSSVSSPTGSVSETIAGDPRFGMLAPLPIVTMTNGSKSIHMTQTRSVTLSDPNNILSLASLVETSTVNDKSWTSSFDAATRTIAQLSPAGRQSSATLDAKGRTVLVHRPSLVDSTMTYDSRGRLGSMALGSRSTTFGYDGADRLTSVTDPLHRTVTFGYDAASRVTSQTLPDGRAVGFTYDASGNVTSITPPSRPSHGFTFTPVDLTDQYTPPAVQNGGATAYRYNKDRELTLITRADAQTIALDYDTAGRVAKLSTAGTILNYGYDGAGRLASVANSNGSSLAYTYDGSLLTSQTWTGEVSGSVGLTYDNELRLASENGIAFSYDADGLLTTAGALNLQRDAQTGFLTGTTLGSTSDTWTYNSFGEPMTHAVSIAGSEVLRDEYTRDDAGRITQIAESVSGATTTTAYGYDPAGRLATVTHDNQPVASYAYDANGNRSGGTYDDQDRLLSLGGTTYTYTNNGELATKTDASGVTAYTYDPLGNLRTVLLPDGKRIDYVIDAQNRRVGKKVNGILAAGWLYADQTRIVAETDGSGVVTKRFTYATRANAPDYMLFNGVTYRFVADHLGSPRYILETSSGTLVSAMSYDEFGNVLSESTPGFQPFGFAGGLCDRDTGLVHFGAREYDPQTGRWISKDPTGFDGLDSNIYAYVASDPINSIDFTGLDAVTSDPDGLAIMASLLRKANFGNSPYEQNALILRNPTTGKLSCLLLPSSHEANRNTFTNLPHPWRVAYIHTHPNGRTVRADQGDDPRAANTMGIPLYALSRTGIHKFDPHDAHPHDTEEVNGAAYRQSNNKEWFDAPDPSNCGCH